MLGNDMLFKEFNEEYFDEDTTSRLGFYVYALCDPRDKKVFYVGKAGGKEGKGNNRIFSHFDEARQALKDNVLGMNQKTRHIIDIWSADEEVGWYIIRHGLPNEESALHVEAALIDLLGISQNGPALNIVRGHGASGHGILTREMVREFGAKPVSPTRSYPAVFIFPIQNAVARGETIYEATRKAWAVSEEFRTIQGAVAVGVANGISKGVFDIDFWDKYDPVQPQLKDGKKRATQLWFFEKKQAVSSELLGCDFSAVISTAMGYWQLGNYLIISIVASSNGKVRFRFLRGSEEKKEYFDF